MFKHAKQRLKLFFLGTGAFFALLWWGLTLLPPTSQNTESQAKLPFLFATGGTKLLAQSAQNGRKSAHFDFASARIEAKKEGIEAQVLTHIHGYIQTELNVARNEQEIYYFSAPKGLYRPDKGRLDMSESHFTLAHMPIAFPKERLFSQAPTIEGAAKKTSISLEKGAEIETGRVRAIIYDTKRLKKEDSHASCPPT